MNFAELVCRVAAAKFAESARLGVRLSPVNIAGSEVQDLVVAGRAILPPGTYIALAAPDARTFEDERTCVSDGEVSAERATRWRNELSGDERILYVSARRLGRAGGLEDTLFELTDAMLREGLLNWCEAELILPKDLVGALRAAGILESVDARSLCRFAAAANGQPRESIGSLLPILDLAADSRLAEGPSERLKANARWVRNVATADNRGIGKMDARTVAVRQQLAAAIGGDGGASPEGLAAVDLGVLSNDELNSDAPKIPRAPRQKREPTPSGFERPTRNLKPAAKDNRTRGTPAAVPSPSPTVPAPMAVAVISDPEGERDFEPEAQLELGLGADQVVGHDDVASLPAKTPAGTEPPARRPGARAGAGPRSRPLTGPWTATMHLAERGPASPLPDGILRLVGAVMDGDGSGLVWAVVGEAGAVLLSPPKALRDPSRQPEDLLDATLVGEWRSARREVMAVLGGAAMLGALSDAPYSVLGDDRLTLPLQRAREASSRLLEAACAAGSAALVQALALDTAAVVSTSGGAVVALAPTHPLVLGGLTDRLSGMARAACLQGVARSLVAADVDCPLMLPMSLPTLWGGLAWSQSPSVAPIYGERGGDDPAVSGAIAEACAGLARLNPHSALGLTLAAETAVAAVARGVVQALVADSEIARATLYCQRTITLSEAGDGMVRTGRLRLEPLDEGVRPHLWVRLGDQPEPISETPAQPDLGLRWRRAELPAVDLANVRPARDPVAWTLVCGPRLTGAPRRPSFVLSRGVSGGSVFALITADPRGAARALTPTYKALGVERLTPKTIEHLTRDLSVGAAGLVSLDPAADGRVASLLIELVTAQTLGEDAQVSGLMGAILRTLLGVPSGAFCVGAIASAKGVRIAFGVGLITRGPGASEIAALERGLEVVRLANRGGEVGSAARNALASALGSGWRQRDDGPSVIDLILKGAPLTAEVFLVGSTAGSVSVAGSDVAVKAVTPAMLEQLVMGIRAG